MISSCCTFHWSYSSGVDVGVVGEYLQVLADGRARANENFFSFPAEE